MTFQNSSVVSVWPIFLFHFMLYYFENYQRDLDQTWTGWRMGKMTTGRRFRTLSWTLEGGATVQSVWHFVCLCKSASRWQRCSRGGCSGTLTEWGRLLQNDTLITSAPPRRVPEKVGSDNSDAFSCETLPHSQTHTQTQSGYVYLK